MEITDQAAPIEFWGERKGMLPWKLAAAQAFKGWAPGQRVTEREFDAAVEAQGQQVSR
jgi:hypothetical protein